MTPNIIIQAPTRLDGLNAGDFGTEVKKLIEAGAHRVILDLGALEYLSSAGVRALLIIHQTITTHDGKLALLALRPSAREVLRICGAEKIAPQAESIEAARRWVE
jgi:anti-anti-sigma factor